MVRRAVLAGFAWLVACGDNAFPTVPPLASGDATLTLAADGSALVLARAGTPLVTFHADGFQIGTVDDLDAGDSFDPYWLFVDAPPEPPGGLTWHTAQRLEPAGAAQADALTVAIEAGGVHATVTFTPEGANGFAAKFVADEPSTQSVAYYRIRPEGDPTEAFYGLGEWGDTAQHRGKLRPMQMELDLSAEGGDDENHVPVPLLLGTTGWGLFVESMRPGSFDVARQSDTLVDVAFGTGADSPNGLAFHLFVEDQPLDLMKHYFAITGFPGLPAPWALGPLLWRDETANQAQMIDDISQIRTRHLATSGVWFDRPYATGVETFDFSAAKFDDPPAMLQAIHDAGLRYAVWHSPYTAAGTNTDPAPVQNAYATAHGYFPPIVGVQVNPWSEPIDFTNPDAYAWWQQNLAIYTAMGIEGYKLDYAEDVVVGLNGKRVPWRFADGSDEDTMHYRYQLLYHQAYRDQLPQAGGFLLCRTGRWGDQTRGMIIWPGDLDASFARQGDTITGQSTSAVGGLPAAVVKGLGLSASGFPFYASDTGGYRHAPADNETWLRWVEANAVNAAMEVGDASSEMPWELTAANGRTQASIDTYQKYASLHMRLYPYAWTYAQAIAVTGRPIARAIGLAFPSLGEFPDDEYLFGDSIVAAPIVAAGATSRSLLLPPGTWLDWWTGTPYAGGGDITIDADLDTLPLFLARGAIVPMLRDTIDTTAPVPASSPIDSFANDPGALWLRVAPAATPSQFTVYDGSVIAQQQPVGGALALQFTPGSVFGEGAVFEVIATAAPTVVMVDGVAVPELASRAAAIAATSGWFWEPATGGTLWIKVAGAATVSAR